MISLGMDKLGYTYVNLDECWLQDKRDENGKLQANYTNFPDGMTFLADYAHNNSLKFGVYTSSGNLTCGGRPGIFGYEDVDAQTFASWGIDYLKVDNCYNYNVSAPIRYARVRDALNRTGRPIYHAMCSWGEENVW